MKIGQYNPAYEIKSSIKEGVFTSDESWQEKMKKVDLREVEPYESFVHRTIRPGPNSGYGVEPKLKDIKLGDDIVDIYRTGDENSWHSIFIYVKGKFKKDE